MKNHIIVCPFCENGHAIPHDFDAIHRCGCGACYKICGNHSLDNGLGDIAEQLWNPEELNFIRSVPMDFCNIVVEKDFDRLLEIEQSSDQHVVGRFCKYDSRIRLNLIWVKRTF